MIRGFYKLESLQTLVVFDNPVLARLTELHNLMMYYNSNFTKLKGIQRLKGLVNLAVGDPTAPGSMNGLTEKRRISCLNILLVSELQRLKSERTACLSALKTVLT